MNPINFLFKNLKMSWLFLLFFCLFAGNAEIKAFQSRLLNGEIKEEEMRLAGKQSFSIGKKRGKQIIKWQVDRQETDEKDQSHSLVKNVFEAEGKSASFDLQKIPGKETVYFVRANGKNFKETRAVRIFQADRRQTFTYKSAGNPDVKNYIFVPAKLNADTRVIVVMSGLQRNADEYLDSWTTWAAENSYIVISPLFDEENWKGARSYNLGNVFTGNEGKGELNPKNKWSFTIVDDIQKQIHQKFALTKSDFDIFGHSAGAQFVHRFLLFCPEANIRYAIAANAGWYTLPDLSLEFSYGLRHPLLKFNKKDLINWTNKNLIIMRGTADIVRDEVLRKTDEAEAQGENRFERAAFMFSRAKALNANTKWQLIDVKDVEHDQRKMALAAQEFLEKQNKN